MQLLVRGFASRPASAAPWFLGMNAAHLQSERLDQDVLITVGAGDRFQSPRLARLQAAALVNARSVRVREFTRSESADSHCQMGNLGLALTVMGDWLQQHSAPA